MGQRRRRALRSARERRGIRAGLDDRDSIEFDAVACERRRGRPAGGDHEADGGKRPPLAVLELRGHMRIQSRLGSERMMHERDDLQPRGFARHVAGQRPEREPIDKNRGPVWIYVKSTLPCLG